MTNTTYPTPEQATSPKQENLFRPQVDIVETGEELVLVADLPGVKNDAIDIDFEDGLLTIHGRAESRYPENARFLLSEYATGDYHRTFRIGEQIDASRIRAEAAGGVLTVHLPKAEAVKPRKIAVQSQ